MTVNTNPQLHLTPEFIQLLNKATEQMVQPIRKFRQNLEKIIASVNKFKEVTEQLEKLSFMNEYLMANFHSKEIVVYNPRGWDILPARDINKNLEDLQKKVFISFLFAVYVSQQVAINFPEPLPVWTHPYS